MKIDRYYNDLESLLKPNKALVIYGARRVGKTTLLNDYLAKTKLKYKLGSGDNVTLQEVLGSGEFSKILGYAEGYELIALDEAQKIPNIGEALKILVDQVPGIKVIATGSSSFELSGQVGEPLTGRKVMITLFPVSIMELAKYKNKQEINEELNNFLVYGGYPETISISSLDEKKEILNELVGSYLLKDVLELERVKGPKILLDLLRLLAFQVGNEVSLSELGQQLGIDSKTVSRYLDLLEKTFILFNLRGFSRNLRKEITKKSKYYFFDNGILNAIISNYNALEIRDDTGRLWENFLVAERIKKQSYQKLYSNNYFWRTWDKQEVDWVEEKEGKLYGYEFKWKSKNAKVPKDWLGSYNNASYEVINRENFLEFVA